MERMIQRVWRECIDVELGRAVSADDVRGGDAALRDGQAGSPLRPGDRGRTEITRGSAFKVFSAAPPPSASSGCRRHSHGPSSAGSRSSRRSGARRGSRTSSTARRARCDRRSRSSCLRPSSKRSVRAGHDLLFVRGRARGRRAGARQPASCISAGSSGSSTKTHSPGSGSPTSRCSSGTEEEGRWQAQHHPFTRPAPGWEDRFEEEPARGARASVRPRRQRQRARRRVVQDPRARAAGARVPDDAHDARGATREVRLPARCVGHGCAPARRDRVRDRPDVDGAGEGAEPP